MGIPNKKILSLRRKTMEQNGTEMNVLYQYQGVIDDDALFYNFAKKYRWSDSTKPHKVIKNLYITPISKTNNLRRYYIKVHVKGNYSYLLKPFDTKISEELDSDALFRYFPESDACILCYFPAATALLKAAAEGIGFSDPAPLEISEEERNKLLAAVKKDLSSLSKNSTKINTDWEEFDGTIDVQFITAIEAPYIFIKESYMRNMILDFPNDAAKDIIEKEWTEKWGEKGIAKAKKCFFKPLSKSPVKEIELDRYSAFDVLKAILNDLF